jgi:hypothetical protein
LVRPDRCRRFERFIFGERRATCRPHGAGGDDDWRVARNTGRKSGTRPCPSNAGTLGTGRTHVYLVLCRAPALEPRDWNGRKLEDQRRSAGRHDARHCEECNERSKHRVRAESTHG